MLKYCNSTDKCTFNKFKHKNSNVIGTLLLKINKSKDMVLPSYFCTAPLKC